jgi:hypothetical protein
MVPHGSLVLVFDRMASCRETVEESLMVPRETVTRNLTVSNLVEVPNSSNSCRLPEADDRTLEGVSGP